MKRSTGTECLPAISPGTRPGSRQRWTSFALSSRHSSPTTPFNPRHSRSTRGSVTRNGHGDRHKHQSQGGEGVRLDAEERHAGWGYNEDAALSRRFVKAAGGQTVSERRIMATARVATGPATAKWWTKPQYSGRSGRRDVWFRGQASHRSRHYGDGVSWQSWNHGRWNLAMWCGRRRRNSPARPGAS